MRRFLGVVPVKNEADNWLDACLDWASNFLDGIFVYDDQSYDDSIEVALLHTQHVRRRANSDPSFLEHEGQFRQNAWRGMEEALEPEDGDWILAFDADEFLVGGFDNRVADRLSLVREAAEEMYADAIALNRPEIWSLGQPPKVRTDGWWQGNDIRLVKWKPNGQFRNKKMGCGSVPKDNTRALSAVQSVNLLHLGYSSQEERQKHYDRYRAMRDHGHNPKHIASIIQKPTLSDYNGPMPRLWRGIR